MQMEELAFGTSSMDEKDFIKAYPHPVLLFEPYKIEPTSPDIDTPERSEIKWQKTDKVCFKTLLDFQPLPSTDVNTEEESLVFLTKTSRNPFSNMITVGRAGNNDIILPIPTISKIHAYFTVLEHIWVLYDRNSRNGTFINGIKATPGLPYSLKDDDIIVFGREIKTKFWTPETLWAKTRKMVSFLQA